jgi:G3E family GTPase
MRSEPFDIVLLTGFLGTGKTTLIKDFLTSEDAADVGVVVNEMGEVDVDGAVLAQSAKKVPLALLSNGCICCAADGDLAGTIAMLQEERARRSMTPLRRIVVETSGAARPGPVLRGLQLLGSRARTTCVSTFDARDWQRALETREGRAQLAGAQRIVITKMDLVSDSASRQAVAAARASNPLAQVIASCAADRARQAFMDSEHDSAVVSWDAGQHHNGTADRSITSALVRFPNPIEYDDLAAWLDNLAGLLGERLFRTKGFVRLAGEANRLLLVQGVGTTFATPHLLPTEKASSFLVVIGEQLGLAELQSVEPALGTQISMGQRMPLTLGRPLHEILAASGV